MANRIDTSKVVTWQYNNALTFLNLLEAKEDIANNVIGDAWDSFFEKVFNLETCNDFGLYLWGLIMGFSRPDNISDSLYRRVLRARFYNLYHSCDMPSYLKYLSILLTAGKDMGHPERSLKIIDGLDMTFNIILKWVPDTETIALLETEGVILHPTGVSKKAEMPGQNMYIGFDGWMSYAPTPTFTPIPLSFSPIKLWGYKEGGGVINPGDIMISPPLPYYATVEGTTVTLQMDESTGDCYYIDAGGVRHNQNPTSDGIHTFANNPIEANSFFYIVGSSKYVIVNDSSTHRPPLGQNSVVCYVDADENRHEVGHDESGYYFMATDNTTKIRLTGQHLGVLDMSNFKVNNQSN